MASDMLTRVRLAQAQAEVDTLRAAVEQRAVSGILQSNREMELERAEKRLKAIEVGG